MDEESSKVTNESTKGKVVLSKCAVAAWVVITLLVIVAVGLLAGLINRPSEFVNRPLESKDDNVSLSTTTAKMSTKMSTTTTSVELFPWSNVRLPNTLVPSHYKVDLQPFLIPRYGNFYTFNGSSSVTFFVRMATPYIIIHSYKLNYSEVMVVDNQDQKIAIRNYTLFVPNQFLVITMEQELIQEQNYTLKTIFEGELSEIDLNGLYRSTYENEAGDTVVIATSQMQPTYARKTFPCFDEPALKATFDISLWHTPPNFALSNMQNITTEPMYDNWMRTSFERTEIMSTYLLAFVVCDFGYVGGMTEDMIQTNIYARPQTIKIGNGDYARNITPVIIDDFETYFNVNYPLSKSDQIAMPDFEAGGMENWGLVIYLEESLLFNPEINSAANKQLVSVVIAHELAHQWFGNLITPTWWDELWLNEGFATYMEYVGTDFVEPTFNMKDQFIVYAMQSAMKVDALTTSRPIVTNVLTPEEINSIFDVISYHKGACIIRMINEFTGEAFIKGLTKYLKRNEYGSVDHQQLFAAWELEMIQQGNENSPPNSFGDSMDTWILQMGYPVITMSRSGNTSNVTITQERFLLDPTANKSLPASPFGYKWDVPLWYIIEGDSEKTLRWIGRNGSDRIDVPRNQYFIGNYEVFGYYRVNYDTENWMRIINQLNTDFSVINVKSRGQLINDAFTLARAELLSFDIALGMTKFLSKDFAYVPWQSAFQVMSFFNLVLGRSYAYGPYSAYILSLVVPLYQNLSWEGVNGHMEQLQQVNAIQTACAFGYQDCIDEATLRFARWMNGTAQIDPNLRTSVYCNGIRFGGVEEWDFAWMKYLDETNSQEKNKIGRALACTREPWIIQRFLDQMVLNTSLIRGQDLGRAIGSFCSNEYSRDITWDFLRSNWDYIREDYGASFFVLSRAISDCSSHFSTDFELQELEVFKETNADKLGSVLRTTDQALEKTKTNVEWRKSHEYKIYQWLIQSI